MMEHKINFSILRQAVRDPTLKPIDKVVLMDLLLYAGTTDRAFPSEATLAKNQGVTDRYIRDVIVHLKDSGWISWKKNGYSVSNRYNFNQTLYPCSDGAHRNSVSYDSGTQTPLHSGIAVPPIHSQESNQHKGSQAQQLFEETFKTKCTPTEATRLQGLTSSYTEEWVAAAIKEALGKHKPFVTVGLIELILSDWKRDGKPEEKPKLVACGLNGCKHGYIFTGSSYVECNCLLEYKIRVQKWEKSDRRVQF